MTIKIAATTLIDVYRRSPHNQGDSGAFEYFNDYAESVFVTWLPQKSEINFDYMQQRPRRKATILTDDPAIYAMLPEQLALVVLDNDGSRYKVTGRVDVANRGECFNIGVEEILDSEGVNTVPFKGVVVGGQAPTS